MVSTADVRKEKKMVAVEDRWIVHLEWDFSAFFE